MSTITTVTFTYLCMFIHKLLLPFHHLSVCREKTVVSYDVTLDPTLPRTHSVKCPECDNKEAVYYQSPVGKNDEALVLVFICVICSHKWLSSDN